MKKNRAYKTQILELRKAWDAISDDGDDLGGLKDAETIESDVQDLIINYYIENADALLTISGWDAEK